VSRLDDRQVFFLTMQDGGEFELQVRQHNGRRGVTDLSEMACDTPAGYSGVMLADIVLVRNCKGKLKVIKDRWGPTDP
jgi:hypothetical protein